MFRMLALVIISLDVLLDILIDISLFFGLPAKLIGAISGRGMKRGENDFWISLGLWVAILAIIFLIVNTMYNRL